MINNKNDDIIEIKENPELGRYVIAKRDIKSGEILFEEEPFVIGPKPNITCVCLGCYCPINGYDGVSSNEEVNYYSRCTKCGWPLCTKCIENNAKDHQNECKLFSTNNVKFQDVINPNDICIQLDCVTPLRILLQKELNSDRWDKEISLMEYHAEARKNSEIWKADQTNIIGYLRGPCKLKDRFSEELIQQVCGILEVNSFEGRTSDGYSIRCIFPGTALMAHSCVPNTSHSILPNEDFRIKVRATTDIGKDELLYATYTYTLTGTMTRQSHLKLGKFFTCNCKRCTDPTELGTHFSTFKCNKCDLGIIMSTNPLDLNAIWKCSHCEFQTSGGAIHKVINVIQSEIDVMQEMDIGPEKLQMCETLIHKYRSVLHPNHFIQTNLRQHLIEMYGRVNGYEINELPDVLLERKLELCKQVLNILNKFEPGKTRSRAMLLYEMHVPIVCMAKSAYGAGVLDNDALRSRLHEAIEYLTESKTILEWEDPCSSEGMLAKICETAIAQLNENFKSIK